MHIRELTFQEYNEKILPLVPSAFASTFSYSVYDVHTEQELKELPNLKESFSKRIFIILGAFDDAGNIVGWSSSFQGRALELYTINSVVLPDHRRKGLYSKMTKMVVELAREKGFQMVTSNHNVANNSVIIAKMKLGFKITGFELSDDHGSLVKLTYYLNETRDRAFDFRAGQIRPDDELKRLFKL